MIATAWELVNSLPISTRADVKVINDLIEDVEENIFRKCFSIELRDLMLADLNSNVGINYWAKTEPFVVNEYCIYQGLKYRNVSASTSTGDDPTIKTTVWQLQQKFNTTKYNDLWNKYLKKYIAYNVAIPGSHFATVRMQAGGLMVNRDTQVDQTSVGTKEMYDYKNQLIEQAKMIFDNMKSWLVTNNNYGTIAIISECEENGCNTNQRNSRFNLYKNKPAYSY